MSEPVYRPHASAKLIGFGEYRPADKPKQCYPMVYFGETRETKSGKTILPFGFGVSKAKDLLAAMDANGAEAVQLVLRAFIATAEEAEAAKSA